MVDDRVAVIVPAMNRPQNVKPFMDSFEAAMTHNARVYWVCDSHHIEQLNELEKFDCEVIMNSSGRKNFASKANVGYRTTEESWILLVGDDVIFHERWLNEALTVARKGFSLVSTNDLGNHNVRNGELAIHPLIRRQWVDESGASWDGPGYIAHEGYVHNCVDREWTAVAKMQNEFAFAPKSIIEHMHPNFKKAKRDEIYEIGKRAAGKDDKLFRERKRRFLCLI